MKLGRFKQKRDLLEKFAFQYKSGLIGPESSQCLHMHFHMHFHIHFQLQEHGGSSPACGSWYLLERAAIVLNHLPPLEFQWSKLRLVPGAGTSRRVSRTHTSLGGTCPGAVHRRGPQALPRARLRAAASPRALLLPPTPRRSDRSLPWAGSARTRWGDVPARFGGPLEPGLVP